MKDLFLERDAVFSENGLYRYLLRRTWDHDLPRALFIMLNSSVAGAELDDPTIRSVMRLCRAWNFGSFEVGNQYGWITPYPDDLAKADDPIGPRNDVILDAAIRRCDMTVCAWGANPMASRRKGAMVHLIGQHRPAAYCLGLTKHGAPKHPLYIKTGTPLVLYR